MKTKVEKGLRYLAAGIFFMALVLNVKFTLDSPYFLSGYEVVAQTNGAGTSTGTDTSTTKVYKHPNTQTTTMTKVVTTYYKFSVKLNIWIITEVMAEAGRTEQTTISYQCCYPGGPGCDYAPCD